MPFPNQQPQRHVPRRCTPVVAVPPAPTFHWSAFCRRFLLGKLAFWLACSTVAILALTPLPALPVGLFDWWDKAQHALAFAVLCGLGCVAYPNRIRWVLLGLVAFGAGIEVAQAATGWRYGEIGDLLADALGVAGAGLAWRAWLKLSVPT